MTPAEQAALVYEREPCSHTFEHDLYWHLVNGYVFSTPDFFVMGRGVDRGAPETLILDVECKFTQPNAWLIWLAAGDMRAMLEMIPHYLPYMGFQRRNKLRWYGTTELRKRLAQVP